MANAIYPKAREAYLNGDIDWAVDDIRIVAVDSGYAYSSAHDFLNDVGAPTRVFTSASLTGKTSTDGVADAADVTQAAVTGDVITGIIVYKHTGVESTSPLIAFYDTDASGVPISITPDGTDVLVSWSNGANKMFRI